MRIYNNISAMTAYRSLMRTDGAIAKSMERLSSGLRINSAADDATGLVISEQMRNQISGFSQAIKNAQQGMSMLRTAEGAMGQQGDLLNRIRDLVLSSNSGNMTADNLATVQTEITELVGQINDIATNTEYNTKKLLNGDLATTGVVFQVGANDLQSLSVTINDTTSATLGLDAAALDVTVADSFSTNIAAVDGAIKTLTTARADLGSKINRFEASVNNLTVSRENLQASESLVRDLDMAEEMVQFTRNQVLSQASTAMLAQANQRPQAILQLLR